MKAVSTMYLIQCEKHECRTNSVVTRIFCDVDQGDVDPAELDFSGNHIGDAGVRAAIGTLHTIRRLQRVSFRGCHMEEGAAIALYEAFKGHPNIREIDIRDNALFASSGWYLTMLARANPNIHRLQVDTSEMPERVSAALSRVLARNHERAFPAADRVAEEARQAEEERRRNVLSSAYLDTLLETLQTPQPAEVMRAVQERVVHHWYARMGPYAALQLADMGISDATIGYLSSLEKSVFNFDSASVDSPPTLKTPSHFLLEEVGRINAALVGEGSILRLLGAVRGMTIPALVETINRLAELLRTGIYTYEEPVELASAAAGALPEADAAAEVSQSVRSVNVVAKLTEVMYGFRLGVAGVSLWDVVRYDPMDDAASVTWEPLQGKCREFEEGLSSTNAYTVNVVYEQRRKLSLLCDMCRYLGMNYGPFVAETRARTSLRAHTAGGCPSFDDAMAIYHAALGLDVPQVEDAPVDRSNPSVQRRELIREATTAFPGRVAQFLQYVQEAHAYEAAASSATADTALENLPSDGVKAVSALVFPMYFFRSPTAAAAASEVVGERSPTRPRYPHPSNVGDELRALREQRRKDQDDAVARTQRLKFASHDTAPELADEVVYGGRGILNGRDVTEILGQIRSKHDLQTFLLAVDAWNRYDFILRDGRLRDPPQ